jgi:hypothetical protein
MATYKVTTLAEVRRVYYIEAKDPAAAAESIEGRYPGEQETISEKVLGIEEDSPPTKGEDDASR